jgi:hypothetical protein
VTDSDQTSRPFAALPKPETDESAIEEPRARRGFSVFPDGAIGIFLLLILAAISGGLIAVYWPWVQGGSESSTTNDRLTTLESRLGQIAAGHAPNVAAAAFGDEQRALSALKMRLDADEARLTAMEKASGELDSSDLGALKSDIDKDAAGIAQLNGRVVKLEQSPAGAQPAAQALAQLRKDLDTRTQAQTDASGKLGERVVALEKNAPPADLATRLDSFALKTGEDALDMRIAKLEGQNPTEMMRRAASLLALADLARASAGAESFTAELSALRALEPASPELADLSKYAASGAPTRAMLSERFSSQADAILAAERSSQAQSWTQRLWANLANLISIRRVGQAQGDDSESRVARAESDLHVGDLDRAMDEVTALKGAARNAAKPWLATAQARFAVDRDTRALMSRVVASLSEPLPAPTTHSPL